MKLKTNAKMKQDLEMILFAQTVASARNVSRLKKWEALMKDVALVTLGKDHRHSKDLF
jgi:hypothetical protein